MGVLVMGSAPFALSCCACRISNADAARPSCRRKRKRHDTVVNAVGNDAVEKLSLAFGFRQAR
jgi:hypothetical protein